MYKFFEVPDDIYESCLGLWIGDKDKFNKYLKDLNVPESCKVTNQNGKTISWEKSIVIWLPRLKNSREIATLYHELLHVVTDVFERRGIPISLKNDEAMAYYQQMLFNNIIKKLKLCVSLESAKSATKKKSLKKH